MMLWQQLTTLLYKNWLIQRRKWLWSLLELLLPLALTGTLLAVNRIIVPKKYSNKTYETISLKGDSRDFKETMIDGLEIITFQSETYFNPKQIYYAPNTSFINDLMLRLQYKLNHLKFWDENNGSVKCVFNDGYDEVKGQQIVDSKVINTRFIGYEKAEDLEKSLYELLIPSYPNTFYAGVVFSTDFAQQNSKTNAQYQLRFGFEQRNVRLDENAGSLVYTWDTDKVFSEDLNNLNPNPNSSDGGIPNYWREAFLTLQRAMDTVLIYTMAPGSLCTLLNTSVNVQRFPFPAYVNHPLFGLLPTLLPAVLVLSFVLSALYITRSLTVEKETKLVEYVGIITGLSPWVQSLAHFIVNFLKLVLIIILITVMLWYSIFENSNPFLIGLFLFLYVLNVLIFSFTVATFFNSVNNATLCAGVMWFLLYIPCLYLQNKFNSFERIQIFSFTVLPNAAVVVFSQIISSLESQGTGLMWNNFLTKPFSKSKFAVFECYLMLIASLLPPILIRLVVNFVHVIWKSYGDWSQKIRPDDPSQPIRFDVKRVEMQPNDVTPSVVVEKAYKTFSNGSTSPTKALNYLSLNVLPGELTVVLGHNGAGKSTLMNVLTGITSLTDGSAYIQNYDVACDMKKIRKVIGYCPQYNMLFNQMTVMEHLKFFSKMRRAEYESDKARRLMKRLGLWEKRHNFSKHLSGGQKRRLCLAIALINNANVVFLDEATSGMDPGAKRDILELIKYEKRSDRTFVMVTHYVDEAETLGDRVAIVAAGQLQCCGTNMFLKNRFGNGYRLTLKFKHTIEQNLQLFVDKILNIVHESCPGSSLLQFTGTEARYLLCPLNNATNIDCSDIRAVVESLENLQCRLPIDSFSISMPTMQDVFMNMYSKDNQTVENNIRNKESVDSIFVKSDVYNEGVVLFFQQFLATLYKRAIQQWRKRWLLCVQCCLLIATVGGSLVLNRLLTGYKPMPPAKSMTVSEYAGSQFLLASDIDGVDYVSNVIRDSASRAGLKTFEPGLTKTNLNMSRYILEQSTKSGVAEFMESSYVGLTIQQTMDTLILTGYFNKWAIHSSSAIVNFMDNVILKTFCNKCSLVTENYPLPQTIIIYYRFGEDFIIVLCLAVGLSFFMTNFASSLVDERANGARHMQILSGLNPVAYWSATMSWDGPVYCLCSCGVVLMWWIGGCQLLVDDGAWLDMIILFALHGWAILPFNYLFSIAFNSSAAAITAITAVSLILNLVPTLAVTTLASLSFNDNSLKDTEKMVSDICSLILPHFTLSKSIITYYNNRLMRKQCQAMKVCDSLETVQSDYFKITARALQWESPGIGRFLTCLAAQGAIYIIVLALTEWWYLSLKHSLLRLLRTKLDRQAIEIAAHELSPNSSKDGATMVTDSRYVLDVRELFVQYTRQSKPAVEGLSFRVERGEIFGLNGENGSGKTTTYKILTGQLIPNYGVAYINDVDAVKNWRQASKHIGFCPQFDCLLEFLTANECLVHYCHLKGIQGDDISDIVESILKAVGLINYKNQIIKCFSGGNKRKLSLAIALIGAPPLILLDEPTCGVDPKARRKIWKVLQIMKTLGCGIVLTSHDMEECETLCSRLMIMVEGRCKCTGSPQNLLDQYANVLNLKLTVAPDTDVETFKAGVERLFKNAELKAQPNAYQFHYTVPTTSGLLWSTAFKYIEILKTFFVITDFALSQPTLYEVFIAITNRDA